MIKAEFLKNHNQNIYQFTVSGHAEFDESGKDIVCSAVTALTFATINSIEELLNINFSLNLDQEEGGFLQAHFSEQISDEKLQLLLEHLYLALSGIQEEYSKYLSLKIFTD